MTDSNYQWHFAEDPQALATQLAQAITAQINKSIAQSGSAVVALSGGSTPKPLFQALAKQKIDWSRLVITLVDERWVPESHELSNAAFLHRYLLDSLPTDVTFIPLYCEAARVEDSFPGVLSSYCEATNSSIDNPRPFDVAVLGMGNDGHTASFFPDAENITDLVDPDTEARLLSCASESTQVDRITWSLPMLLDAQLLILHMTGQNKKQVFQQAILAGPVDELPIRSVLFQTRVPLHVYYAD